MTHTSSSCSFNESKVVCSDIIFCNKDLSLAWIVLEEEEGIVHQKMVSWWFSAFCREGSLCGVESRETNLCAAQA